MSKLRLLVASTNPGKLKEFQEILADESFELHLPISLGIHLTVVEDGATYAQNAAKKALAYCQTSGILTLADDSGLEVDALGGAPGLYSARYSSLRGATDAHRRAYLLENLSGKPRPWTASFHCAVAVASPSGDLHITNGICPGEIIVEERGSNGFGYDPIFLLTGRGLTMAELDSAEKNRISHRALAVRAALPILKKYS
jgi:XTP/dITP diphosphohydrolase